ncbi:MAG: SusC/RagA family TonB-linked outer membrane protein [Mucilaginibacter sp.]
MPQYLAAQVKRISVKGVVTDKETKESLIGVSISLDGTPPKGLSATSYNGEFSVTVPAESSLIFHSVGYKDKKVKLNAGQTQLNVEMASSSTSLNEVVLRGYVSRSKEVTTGQSYTISGSEIQDVPVSNAIELIQGKVPGVNIQVNTGAPGYGGSILVRGLTGIGISGSGGDSFLQPTSPLFVIDGIPIDADNAADFGFDSPGGVSPLQLIPVEDIASIEVLTDAQATASYGSKGAYGVFVIQTRRGNSKKPKVRYTGNYFVTAPPNLRTTLGGKAERDAKIREILANGSYSDLLKVSSTPILSDSLNAYYRNSTDWQGIYYVSTYNTSHNIGIDGGDTRFNYSTNLNYFSQNGIIRNTGFKRYTMKMLMDYRPDDKFHAQIIFNVGLGKRNNGNGQGLLQTGVAANATASSLLPGPSLFQETSSVANDLTVKDNNDTKTFSASALLGYQLFKGFSLTNTGSYSYSTSAEDTEYPAAANNNRSQVYSYNDRNANLYNRAGFTYNKDLRGHSFFLQGFNEISAKDFQAGYIDQVGLANDQLLGPLGYGTWASRGGGVLKSFHNEHTLSFAGLFSYNYKRKYILDLNYRLDGSSLAGFDSPFQKEPGIGFRWNFDKEKFFANESGWLNAGDIRLTYGQVIRPTADIYSIYGQYGPTGVYEGYNRIGINHTTLPNSVLKPTTNTTYNLGVDMTMFNNKFSFIFNTYFKQVTNIPWVTPVTTTDGFANLLSTDASQVNYGYELVLTLRPLSKTSKVQWNITAQGSINKDFLTKLPGNKNQIIIGTTVLRAGRNTYSYNIFNYQGVYATDAQVPVDPVTGLKMRTNASTTAFFKAGDPIWNDKNGDYVIDDNDRQAMGNSQALVTGGLNTNVNYKGFGLNMNGSFTLRRDIINDALASRLRLVNNPFGTSVYLPITDLNYWKQPGDQAAYPNPFDYTRTGAINPYRSEQSLFMASGSYFKINNITLSYNFNKQFINKLGLANLRIYASANNVITFSPYAGPNPENVTRAGWDVSGGYPVSRTYNVGLNLEF